MMMPLLTIARLAMPALFLASTMPMHADDRPARPKAEEQPWTSLYEANLGPGTSVGTLNIGGDLTISALAGGAGLLKYELNTIAASDKLVLATGKVLTIGSGALGLSDFNFTDLGGLQNGTYP